MPNENRSADVADANSSAKALSKKERRKLKVTEKSSTGEETKTKFLEKASKENLKSNKENSKYSISVESSKESIKAKVAPIPSDSTQNVTQSQAQKNKEVKSSESTEGKSKAQLRAERRELQEKQRLEKLAEKETKTSPTKPQVNNKILVKVGDARIKSPKKILDTDLAKKHSQRVQLFSHLERTITYKPEIVYSNVHPLVIHLGAQYASKTILGSDARCLALLRVVKQLINDFQTPFNQEFCRAFESYLSNNVEHLQRCRPMAVSMTNALRHFKLHLTQIQTSLADSEKKEQLQSKIEQYVEEEIDKAIAAISIKVCEKITDNDVILTYGHSSLVNKILIDAKMSGKQFKVIVVDARPLLEGRQTLNKLIKAGIECTYILITATSFIMNRATKVIVGAHALLNNGYVKARTGTALVALIAKTHMKPVLVCCETSKFSEHAQTDSFVSNEMGDPNDVMDIKTKNGYLNALNLMYDVTPPKYVTGVATELGILPCTSVPVILRLKPME